VEIFKYYCTSCGHDYRTNESSAPFECIRCNAQGTYRRNEFRSLSFDKVIGKIQSEDRDFDGVLFFINEPDVK